VLVDRAAPAMTPRVHVHVKLKFHDPRSVLSS